MNENRDNIRMTCRALKAIAAGKGMGMSALLEEVAQWKIDAADETNARYFVRFPSVDRIEGGDVSFVIGRKGTGKTAIADYLSSLKNFSTFSKSLSFDGFPFNLLYKEKDEAYTPHGQYTSIWRYLILSTVCSLMADNEAVSPDCRKTLSTTLKPTFDQALGGTVAQLTSKNFGASFAGSGASFGTQRSTSRALSISERGEALERLVLEQVDSSVYLLLFDALDNDYVELGRADELERYLNLVSGLFKAVSYIHNLSLRYDKRIYPVVFIREDIFDLLKSPDKNKWLDKSVSLSWSSTDLASMITQRLRMSWEYAYPLATPGPKSITQEFFESDKMLYARGRSAEYISMVEYMLRVTSFRPRDIVLYMREAARAALSRNRAWVSTKDIKNARPLYSRYYMQELVDEIYPVVPNIQDVLVTLSKFPIIFTLAGLEDALGAMTREKGNFRLSAADLVKILYYFNIIGNVDREGAAYFRYNSIQKSIDYERDVLIHKGVRRALMRDGVENLTYAKVPRQAD